MITYQVGWHDHKVESETMAADANLSGQPNKILCKCYFSH